MRKMIQRRRRWRTHWLSALLPASRVGVLGVECPIATPDLPSLRQSSKKFPGSVLRIVQEHFFKPLHMDTASYFYTPQVEQQLTKLYRSEELTPYSYWHICYR